MCRYCDEPCWRDGSEGECAYTDAEWMRIDAEVHALDAAYDEVAEAKPTPERNPDPTSARPSEPHE